MLLARRRSRVDPDSTLAQDLVTLKKKENQDHILLHFIFKVAATLRCWLQAKQAIGWDMSIRSVRLQDSFPYEPPFVRIVHPTVSNGFVLGGGAICMELLTKQVSPYDVHLLFDLSSTLLYVCWCCVSLGLEQRLQCRVCDFANCCYFGQRKSEDSVWNEGEKKFRSQWTLRYCTSKNYFTLLHSICFRVSTAWLKRSSLSSPWFRFTRKAVNTSSIICMLIACLRILYLRYQG